MTPPPPKRKVQQKQQQAEEAMPAEVLLALVAPAQAEATGLWERVRAGCPSIAASMRRIIPVSLLPAERVPAPQLTGTELERVIKERGALRLRPGGMVFRESQLLAPFPLLGDASTEQKDGTYLANLPPEATGGAVDTLVEAMLRSGGRAVVSGGAVPALLPFFKAAGAEPLAQWLEGEVAAFAKAAAVMAAAAVPTAAAAAVPESTEQQALDRVGDAREADEREAEEAGASFDRSAGQAAEDAAPLALAAGKAIRQVAASMWDTESVRKAVESVLEAATVRALKGMA